jgi:hypothetical protein
VTTSLRNWLVDHLPWITVALLVLWLPPVVVAIAVGFGILTGEGYPRLVDPAVVLPAIELALMIAAVPLLARRAAAGWTLLAWSRVAVLLQTAWTILLNARLAGLRSTLLSRPIVEAIVGLAVGASVLVLVRTAYTGRNR